MRIEGNPTITQKPHQSKDLGVLGDDWCSKLDWSGDGVAIPASEDMLDMFETTAEKNIHDISVSCEAYK